jgi:uncharacterized protein YlxW (UPF0749 family)
MRQSRDCRSVAKAMKLREAIKITKKRISTLKARLKNLSENDSCRQEIEREIKALEMVVEFAEIY